MQLTCLKLNCWKKPIRKCIGPPPDDTPRTTA